MSRISLKALYVGLAVLAGVSFATEAAFGGLLYTTEYSGRFGTVDTTSGTYTQIRSDLLSGQFPQSLAWDGGSGFFTGASDLHLYPVTSSGVVSSPVGSTPVMYGMSRSSTGIMYFYNYDDDTLSTIDTVTGLWSNIGASNIVSDGSSVGGRLAFYGQTLYGAISTSSDSLYGSFDLDTGAFSVITSGIAYKALASDGKKLYGLSANSLYTLNPADGTVVSTLSITGAGSAPVWQGAAFIGAVPEIDPATGSSALSLVAGVLAMIEQRLRRGKLVA